MCANYSRMDRNVEQYFLLKLDPEPKLQRRSCYVAVSTKLISCKAEIRGWGSFWVWPGEASLPSHLIQAQPESGPTAVCAQPTDIFTNRTGPKSSHKNSAHWLNEQTRLLDSKIISVNSVISDWCFESLTFRWSPNLANSFKVCTAVVTVNIYVSKTCRQNTQPFGSLHDKLCQNVTGGLSLFSLCCRCTSLTVFSFPATVRAKPRQKREAGLAQDQS